MEKSHKNIWPKRNLAVILHRFSLKKSANIEIFAIETRQYKSKERFCPCQFFIAIKYNGHPEQAATGAKAKMASALDKLNEMKVCLIFRKNKNKIENNGEFDPGSG